VDQSHNSDTPTSLRDEVDDLRENLAKLATDEQSLHVRTALTN